MNHILKVIHAAWGNSIAIDDQSASFGPAAASLSTLAAGPANLAPARLAPPAKLDQIGLGGSPMTDIINADFESGWDGFVYQDDVFGTNQPSYASGARKSKKGFDASKGLELVIGRCQRGRHHRHVGWLHPELLSRRGEHCHDHLPLQDGSSKELRGRRVRRRLGEPRWCAAGQRRRRLDRPPGWRRADLDRLAELHDHRAAGGRRPHAGARRLQQQEDRQERVHQDRLRQHRRHRRGGPPTRQSARSADSDAAPDVDRRGCRRRHPGRHHRARESTRMPATASPMPSTMGCR